MQNSTPSRYALLAVVVLTLGFILVLVLVLVLVFFLVRVLILILSAVLVLILVFVLILVVHHTISFSFFKAVKDSVCQHHWRYSLKLKTLFDLLHYKRKRIAKISCKGNAEGKVGDPKRFH